jgi:hypothetical protein
MRGDQYVNYSHITLKAGGQHITAGGTLTDIDGVDMESYVNQRVLSTRPCGECKYCIDPKSNVLCVERQRVRSELIAEFNQKIREMAKNGTGGKKKNGEKSNEMASLPRKRSREESGLGKSVNGSKEKSSVFKKKISPPGNPLGNKRMSVPDELLPDFCRRIGAHGTRKRMPTINAFVKDHPEVSIRQVTFKFADITTKDLPGCIPKPEKPKGKGRAFTFFLRPRFYHLIPENERPPEWEKYAKEDEILWEEECLKKKEDEDRKDKNLKDMMENKTTESQSQVSEDLTATNSIDLEEADEGSPPTKKPRKE